jgi:hypothetical protein
MKNQIEAKRYTLDELGEMLIPGLPSPEEHKVIVAAIEAHKKKTKLAEQRRNRRKVLSK